MHHRVRLSPLSHAAPPCASVPRSAARVSQEGRTFHDGDDARWTALDHAPNTNQQVNYYNASLATTSGGKLQLLSNSDDATYPTFDGNGSTETRHLQTAMLQVLTPLQSPVQVLLPLPVGAYPPSSLPARARKGWNKFCFTEGIAEVSAKMPGDAAQPGLWPAFWLMGNLGRATFTGSTDGIWPWIFDECVETSDATACAANQCKSQRISACDGAPGYGLHPYHGRGAPEIDVIEVLPPLPVPLPAGAHAPPSGCSCPSSSHRGRMPQVQPGRELIEYDADDPWRDNCASRPTSAERASIRMTQPFVSTSLQAAPGLANGSLQVLLPLPPSTDHQVLRPLLPLGAHMPLLLLLLLLPPLCCCSGRARAACPRRTGRATAAPSRSGTPS